MMKEKIKNCFDRLQRLNIAPSQGNMEILLQTLYDLKEVYQELGVKEDGRPAADSEGRNND